MGKGTKSTCKSWPQYGNMQARYEAIRTVKLETKNLAQFIKMSSWPVLISKCPISNKSVQNI
jgi:hypothetical protein